MADILSLHLRLFGAFRAHGEEIVIALPYGSTIATLKQALAQKLPQQAMLVAESAISNEMQVLADDYELVCEEPLAVLPPVCGG